MYTLTQWYIPVQWYTSIYGRPLRFRLYTEEYLPRSVHRLYYYPCCPATVIHHVTAVRKMVSTQPYNTNTITAHLSIYLYYSIVCKFFYIRVFML